MMSSSRSAMEARLLALSTSRTLVRLSRLAMKDCNK